MSLNCLHYVGGLKIMGLTIVLKRFFKIFRALLFCRAISCEAHFDKKKNNNNNSDYKKTPLLYLIIKRITFI